MLVQGVWADWINSLQHRLAVGATLVLYMAPKAVRAPKSQPAVVEQGKGRARISRIGRQQQETYQSSSVTSRLSGAVGTEGP
ncbi:hypothetical protein NDU88_005358 [Pleurodeles waltl]|uniref:Uncharacterized protein n=1 Tax=Pleurodeles waltl TaxID=8319 RepID=A0AAV7UHV2_PLEWA|nr:hypothetical protein NDU88_005358 [Pleurodeles waltl]